MLRVPDPASLPPEARALLDWYDRHRRNLPWRRDRDPYRVWLSEVMLQQTRVETVLPYYERFLERFPSVSDLAAADEEEVLALWSGLGYYRRARQLHAAARQVSRRGGEFPDSVEGLLDLPGIGPYTAAAVASIAFGVAEPVLDGNVERVVSRLLATGDAPKSSRGRRRLRARARELLDPRRPGDSNQALMELGATVCTRSSPRCLLCPLRTSCRGRAEGRPENYPAPRRRRQPERVHRISVIVRDAAGVLLFRRPDDAELLAGTWELPWVDLPSPSAADGDGRQTAWEAGQSLSQREASAISRELARRYGGRWSLGRYLGRVRHGITYRSIEVEVVLGEVDLSGAERTAAERSSAGWSPAGKSPAGKEAGFFDPTARRGLPLSSLVGKILLLHASAAGEDEPSDELFVERP